MQDLVKEGLKVPVTQRALLQRLKRYFQKENKIVRLLRGDVTNGKRYCLINLETNSVIRKFSEAQIVFIAVSFKVLKPYEKLV